MKQLHSKYPYVTSCHLLFDQLSNMTKKTKPLMHLNVNYLRQRLNALSSHLDDGLRGAGGGGADVFYYQSWGEQMITFSYRMTQLFISLPWLSVDLLGRLPLKTITTKYFSLILLENLNTNYLLYTLQLTLKESLLKVSNVNW